MMAQNKAKRSAEAEAAREAKAKQAFFDEILAPFHRKGITLAEFLKYVFNPDTQHIFDWRWRGFFSRKKL